MWHRILKGRLQFPILEQFRGLNEGCPRGGRAIRNWSCVALGLALAVGSGQIAGAIQGTDPRSGKDHSLAPELVAKKAAYVVFFRERTRDATELRAYSQKSRASLTDHRVDLLAVYGRQEVLEGAQVEGLVVLRFPSFEEAKTWYDSPAYREARRHRFAGADYRAVIVEGV